ncbi:hypothetical protein C900_03140 [Fulvivirga imtechensis AK7]|uniref:Uncharacterized protein n=1 Tax=Fulvivirga imtechensis AK7 TaxID=1237149 RepID=L8JQ83_9BACT|nr:hypothetical protein [Fulvivirga imtechensis]ELR71010.1 hypothetical protein C900_03140 [Fulvivirga imtechensis AK7]
MKRIILLFFALALTPFGYSQDSLVFLKDVHFNSTFEKDIFHEHFSQAKDNYLALFMAINPQMDAATYDRFASHYQSQLDQIDLEKLKGKKPEKRIKAIYSSIHDRFLKKYELQNEFSSIFSDGFYNCVSASALYGMVFKGFDIPFIIKEKPTHVYVVAYPDTERILVETTDPTGGFITFSERYKQAFVEQMKKTKLISQEEYQAKTASQLFDQYYFADQEINLEELVGVQYTNDAIYKLEGQQLEAAYSQLEKAYLFYPTDKIISLLIAVNVEILDKNNYKNINDVQYLSKLSRFKEFGISREMMLGEFSRINDVYLINKGDAETYRKFYEALVAGIADDTLKQEIHYLYAYERGRILHNQGKYKDALPFFEDAFMLKPDNQDVNNALVTTLGRSLMYESDNLVVIKSLENYRQRHPQLAGNNLFNSALVNAYLLQCGRSFDLNKIDDAIRYKALFEKNFKPEMTIDATNIGRVYSLAAVYYFKKGYTAKAKSIIAQGLGYAPGNHELLVRQRMIK